MYIDAVVRQCAKHLRGVAGRVLHARPHDAQLGEAVVACQAAAAHRLNDRRRHIQRARQIRARHRESQIGCAVNARVLHNNVNADVRRRQRLKQARRYPRPIHHAEHRYLRHIGIGSDATYAISQLAHIRVHINVSVNKRPPRVRETGRHKYRHIVVHPHLDRARIHLSAVAGELQHLFEPYLIQLARARHKPRIRGIDAVHIGIDLAPIGVDACRNRHGGGIRPAAPQRGNVHILGNALKARHDNDIARVQLADNARGIHARDARLAESGIGSDARLRAAEANGRVAHSSQRHSHKRARHQLARREQHIHLARVRPLRHLPCQANQLVRSIAHSRQRRHHAIAFIARACDAPRHIAYLIGVRQRTAAIFLHYQHNSYRLSAAVQPKILIAFHKKRRPLAYSPNTFRKSIVAPASVGELNVCVSPYITGSPYTPSRSVITQTTRSSGSAIQSSLTPYLAYRSRFSFQSRRDVDGDRISTTRSGAPCTLASVIICAFSLSTNSKSGCTTSWSDSTTSKGAK